MRHDQKPEARFTTMFDLYALPSDFPGKAIHASVSDTSRRVELLEQAMFDDLGDRRLIPYLQRHEVEALVLAGLDRLANLLPEERKGIERLREAIGPLSPEDVNDGVATAPSSGCLTTCQATTRRCMVPSWPKMSAYPAYARSVRAFIDGLKNWKRWGPLHDPDRVTPRSALHDADHWSSRPGGRAARAVRAGEHR